MAVKFMEKEKRMAVVPGWGWADGHGLKWTELWFRAMKKFSGRMKVMVAQHGIAGCAYCHRTGHLKMARMVDLMCFFCMCFTTIKGGKKPVRGNPPCTEKGLVMRLIPFSDSVVFKDGDSCALLIFEALLCSAQHLSQVFKDIRFPVTID